MKFHAVIFDLGRVLVDVDFTRGLFPYLDGRKGQDDQTILREVFKNPIFRKYSTGKIDTQTLYQKIITTFNLNMPFDRFSELWCDVFTPMEGMEDIVERVSKRFKLGLLSDTDPLHWEFVLKEYPFLKRFSDPTLSFEIGVLKPAPLCYKKASEHVQIPIEECLFIDDRDINIIGAREAGMEAIQFINKEQLERELKERGIL